MHFVVKQPASLVAVFPLVLLCGCSAASQNAVSLPPAAVSQSLSDPASTRATQALARLTCKQSATACRCRVSVRNSPNPTACGWTDGRIAVTTGLLALLNDDELTAAIAHEMGHMAADGHLPGHFDLNGASRDLSGEYLADEIGCQILTAAGLPRSAMASMLQKINAAPATPASQRPEIAQRLARLSPHCPS